jgi:CBS domain containing-hemolysin-like protein
MLSFHAVFVVVVFVGVTNCFVCLLFGLFTVLFLFIFIGAMIYKMFVYS